MVARSIILCVVSRGSRQYDALELGAAAEIHDQSDLKATDSEVVEELSPAALQQAGPCLDFHKHIPLHEKVWAETYKSRLPVPDRAASLNRDRLSFGRGNEAILHAMLEQYIGRHLSNAYRTKYLRPNNQSVAVFPLADSSASQ